LVIGRVAIIKSGRFSNLIGMTAGPLSHSIKQVRTSGVARISGQGGGDKKIRGGTSNKIKTEKKKTKYEHISFV
jgi:hypothetical protein